MLSFLHPLLVELRFLPSFIVAIFCAIIIHELGHLFASKRCHCTILSASFGFGKILYKKEINNINYQICLIPLGGYLSLKGEMEYCKSKTALTNLKYRQKVYIVLAGIGANCLTAILSFGLFAMFGLSFFFHFAYLSILLGLSNLFILFPGLDGSYPLLFLLEKPLGKKEGIKVMQRAIDIGMFFINVLNIGCIIYFVIIGIYFISKLIKG